MFLNQEKIDKEYNSDGLIWGHESPNTYVVKTFSSLPHKGKVLDLGSGEGRNSIYLAKEGFSVTAVDISEPAIEKLKKSALSYELSVVVIVEDIGKNNFGDGWNAIISTAALHLLTPTEQEKTIEYMKSSTKEGGINLITIFTKNDPGYIEYPALSFMNLEELRVLYSDWTILISEEYQKHETHGVPHDHHIAVLVARK